MSMATPNHDMAVMASEAKTILQVYKRKPGGVRARRGLPSLHRRRT